MLGSPHPGMLWCNDAAQDRLGRMLPYQGQTQYLQNCPEDDRAGLMAAWAHLYKSVVVSSCSPDHPVLNTTFWP